MRDWRKNLYRLFVDNLTTLTRFLSLTEAEYVDAILKSGSSSLINDSSAVFGCITLCTECSVSDTGLQCRIPRKVLQNLAVEGSIDVAYDPDLVYLTFRDSKKVCTARFRRQDIFSDNYRHQLELIAKADFGNKCNLKDYSLFCRIGRSNSSIISYSNGVLGTRLPYNCRAYQKCLLNYNFAALASSLQLLLRTEMNVFSVENFLGVALENLVVLITKARDDVNTEFALIEQEKAKFKCTVNLRNLISFFVKVHPSVDFVELDLEQQLVTLDQGRLYYEIPIEVTDLIKAERASFNKIKIPTKILSGVLGQFPTAIFQLQQKRNFVRLENAGIMVLI